MQIIKILKILMFTKLQKLIEIQFLGVFALITAWKEEHIWVN